MTDHNVNHDVGKWLTISSDDDFLLDLQREDYSILFIHIKFHEKFYKTSEFRMTIFTC